MKPNKTNLEPAFEPLKRQEALDKIPQKHPLVEEINQSEEKALLLKYPVTVRPWFSVLAKKLTGKSRTTFTKKLQLDILGSQVWNMIDGKNSVRTIIKKFAKKHQLHEREAEISVVQFLRSLGKKGLLGMK